MYLHSKNAGLNKTQHWVKYGQTKRLGYCPEGWVKHLTQLLVENNKTISLLFISHFNWKLNK